MNLSSVALPLVGENTATIFVALELSKSTWLVDLHSPAADKISLHRLQGGDTEGLMALIEHRREQAQVALTRPVRVMSCYEAGYDGFWLHRFLCDRGIDNQVLDAASILVDRRSRRAKTDRLDAAALLRTLMALERGQHSSRVKGHLMTQGIRDFKPARRDWREQLETLRTADGRDLPPGLKNEIKRECRRLWQVIEMFAEVEVEQRQAAETTAPETVQLSQLRGIGLTIASVLTNEVFFRDVQNRREVAGYLGLASSPWSRGAVSRDQGIQRSGNPRARRTAIELAWLWLRHQPARRAP